MVEAELEIHSGLGTAVPTPPPSCLPSRRGQRGERKRVKGREKTSAENGPPFHGRTVNGDGRRALVGFVHSGDAATAALRPLARSRDVRPPVGNVQREGGPSPKFP
ncbi:unnamed protein product [Lampetra planeri]